MPTAILRVGLAVVVIGFHSGLPFAGPFAVLSFYVISGGVSMYLLSAQRPSSFILRRFRSLLPGFLVVAVVHYIILHLLNVLTPENELYVWRSIKGETLTEFWGSLYLFLPQYGFSLLPPRIGGGSELVSVYWTVLNEFFMYLLLAVLFIFGYRDRRTLQISSFFVATGLLILLTYLSRGDLGVVNANIYFNVLAGCWFFLVGAITLRCSFQNTTQSDISRIPPWMTATAIVLLLAWGHRIVYPPIEMLVGDRSIAWVIFSIIVAVLTVVHLHCDRASFEHQRHRSKLETLSSRFAYFLYIWQVPFITVFSSQSFGVFNRVVDGRYRFFLAVLTSSSFFAAIHTKIEHNWREKRPDHRSLNPIVQT